jgi:hypothetical protein
MTQEQVIARARSWVVRQRRPIFLEPESVRLMQAARFNALFGRDVYPCDFWIVEFRKVLPAGVAAESPGTIMVEVIPVTGEVREIYVGMHAEQPN